MSRPKLNMPLKEQNSPRSQWISNVSLLKNQLKDGELIESNKRSKESKATKLTWNELEAQLGKRMREKVPVNPSASTRASTTDRSKLPTINTNQPLRPVSGGGGGAPNSSRANNPLSPTSSTLNLIPHPRHSPTRSLTINAPLPPGIPSSPSKRPTLNIPSPRSQDVLLKQVPSGVAHLPVTTTGATAATTTSRTKSVTTKDPSSFVDTKTTSRAKNTLTDADGKYNTFKYDSSKTEPSPLRKKSKMQQQIPPENTVLKTIEEEANPVETKKEEIYESKGHRSDIGNKKGTTRLTKSPTETQPTTTTTNDINEVKAPTNREALNSSSPIGVESAALERQRSTKQDAPQIRQQPMKNKVPRPETTTSATKGSMSWLRRALKPNGSKPTKRSITMSTMTEVSILTTDSINTKSSSKNGYSTSSKSIGKSVKTVVEKYFHPTTPLQLGLWLSEVQKAIRQAKQSPELNSTKDNATTPMLMVDALPSSPQQRKSDLKELPPDQQRHGDGTVNTLGEGEDVYYHKNRDIGVYVDYSTFDDGDSVSSIELLFKWLTCRDLNDAATMDNGSIGRHYRGDGTVMTPPGTVIATESNVSDDLSIDLDARPTRRTFFSR